MGLSQLTGCGSLKINLFIFINDKCVLHAKINQIAFYAYLLLIGINI